jgi:hypothetical protein
VVAGYWRSTQSRKPHTRAGYEIAWRLRIEPRFGSMPVRLEAKGVDALAVDHACRGWRAKKSASRSAAPLGLLCNMQWVALGSSTFSACGTQLRSAL